MAVVWLPSEGCAAHATVTFVPGPAAPWTGHRLSKPRGAGAMTTVRHVWPESADVAMATDGGSVRNVRLKGTIPIGSTNVPSASCQGWPMRTLRVASAGIAVCGELHDAP